ncbi:MAG: type II toxin-antitoxin system HicA family toxin [Nodularia sp. (in: Bacteria)]|nr:MAG: type II toxin-antitoxin system HicA family toxin [Nodularia sp. (in: cyanobacteria)]
MNLNSKQQSILNAISENPVRANIPWKDIESMLIALGAEVSEGKGSRVRFALNGIRATFHRPHPEKETDKGAVKSVRRFLMEAEIVKNDEV